MIHKIYYINLDRRTDRDETIRNEISKTGFTGPVERVSAVDGRTLDIETISDVTDEGKKYALDPNAGFYTLLTPGAIGCALSHKNVAHKVMQEIPDDQYALVLEDDATLDSDFLNKLHDVVQKIPSFDILYLGHHQIEIKKEHEHHNEISKTWGLFGFLINKKGSREFLNLFPISSQIDSEMHGLYTKINVYALKNLLVKSPLSQEDPSTDIQTRVVGENYTLMVLLICICLTVFLLLYYIRCCSS